jgi:hypothetical protein
MEAFEATGGQEAMDMSNPVGSGDLQSEAVRTMKTPSIGVLRDLASILKFYTMWSSVAVDTAVDRSGLDRIVAGIVMEHYRTELSELGLLTAVDVQNTAELARPSMPPLSERPATAAGALAPLLLIPADQCCSRCEHTVLRWQRAPGRAFEVRTGISLPSRPGVELLLACQGCGAEHTHSVKSHAGGIVGVNSSCNQVLAGPTRSSSRDS